MVSHGSTDQRRTYRTDSQSRLLLGRRYQASKPFLPQARHGIFRPGAWERSSRYLFAGADALSKGSFCLATRLETHLRSESDGVDESIRTLEVSVKHISEPSSPPSLRRARTRMWPLVLGGMGPEMGSSARWHSLDSGTSSSLAWSWTRWWRWSTASKSTAVCAAAAASHPESAATFCFTTPYNCLGSTSSTSPYSRPRATSNSDYASRSACHA